MKRTRIAGLVTVLAFGVSNGLGGQDTGGQSSGIRIENRPRLGVSVDLARPSTDSIGAYIQTVVPGSPADKAGIRAGDILVKIDGQPIATGRDTRSPGLRLIGLTAQLEPNKAVPVELRRGKARKTVSVAPSPDISLMPLGMMMDSAGKWSFRIQARASDSGPKKGFFVFITSPWAELETSSLNDELGEYFGTDEGVLVVRAPFNNKLGLRGGDVILEVDGKKPDGPAHFLRMVERKETVRLQVLRHKKRLALTVSPEGTTKQ